MNRRGFLGLLVGLIAWRSGAKPGPWRPIYWYEKEFKDGSIGFSMTFKNRATGQLARQAVRVVGRGREPRHKRFSYRMEAKELLKAWGADLNRDRAFAARAAAAYDDVLEGYERFRLG